MKKTIVLDCETTGLNPGVDEILELAICDIDGNTLFHEFVKPKNTSYWPDAQAVHHISPQMVADKPYLLDFLDILKPILLNADVIIGYNVSFDISFIEGGLNIADNFNYDEQEKIKKIQLVDIMYKFSEIYGEWNEYYQNYTWQKLTTAANYYDYVWEDMAHNALSDVKATLFCYKKIYNIKE